MHPEHLPHRGGRVDPGALEAALRAEAEGVHSWSNGPHDRYAAHEHPYRKVLYCLAGSIDFALGGGRTISMRPGDKLVLPPQSPHSAVVGPAGVTCIEGRAVS